MGDGVGVGAGVGVALPGFTDLPGLGVGVFGAGVGSGVGVGAADAFDDGSPEPAGPLPDETGVGVSRTGSVGVGSGPAFDGMGFPASSTSPNIIPDWSSTYRLEPMTQMIRGSRSTRRTTRVAGNWTSTLAETTAGSRASFAAALSV